MVRSFTMPQREVMQNRLWSEVGVPEAGAGRCRCQERGEGKHREYREEMKNRDTWEGQRSLEQDTVTAVSEMFTASLLNVPLIASRGYDTRTWEA